MKAVSVLALAVAAFAFAGLASAGNPDPRKCVLANAKQCAQQSAVTALRRRMTLKVTGKPGVSWDADITCTTKSAKFLLWACTWKTTTAPSTATVKFWATGTGWHTLVTLE